MEFLTDIFNSSNTEHTSTSPFRTASIALVLGLIVFVTTLGNIFVIAAFMTDRRIRAVVGNWFILNLSVCDLLTGLAVLPFNTYWVIVGRWNFGEAFCKFWLILDFSVTHMSILSILFISLDRYWMVTKTSKYYSFLTKQKIWTMLTMAWGVITTYYVFVTLAWAPITKESPIDFEEDCELDAVFNVYFTITQVLLEFFVPLMVISYLNVVVYTEIKRRARAFVSSSWKLKDAKHAGIDDNRHEDGMLSKEVMKNENRVMTGRDKVTMICSEDLRHFPRTSGILVVSEASPADVRDKVELAACPDRNFETESRCCGETEFFANESSLTADTDQKENSQSSCAGYVRRTQTKSRRSSTEMCPKSDCKTRTKLKEFKRHRKAAITLAVLVSVFVLCWLPYHIVSILNVVCQDCIGDSVWEIVNNLLWCNSTVNPFLYAITNVRFRRNFIRYMGLRRFLRRGNWAQSDTL